MAAPQSDALQSIFLHVRGPTASGALAASRRVCHAWRDFIDAHVAHEKRAHEPYATAYLLGYLSPMGLFPELPESRWVEAVRGAAEAHDANLFQFLCFRFGAHYTAVALNLDELAVECGLLDRVSREQLQTDAFRTRIQARDMARARDQFGVVFDTRDIHRLLQFGDEPTLRVWWTNGLFMDSVNSFPPYMLGELATPTVPNITKRAMCPGIHWLLTGTGLVRPATPQDEAEWLNIAIKVNQRECLQHLLRKAEGNPAIAMASYRTAVESAIDFTTVKRLHTSAATAAMAAGGGAAMLPETMAWNKVDRAAISSPLRTMEDLDWLAKNTAFLREEVPEMWEYMYGDNVSRERLLWVLKQVPRSKDKSWEGDKGRFLSLLPALKLAAQAPDTRTVQQRAELLQTLAEHRRLPSQLNDRCRNVRFADGLLRAVAAGYPLPIQDPTKYKDMSDFGIFCGEITTFAEAWAEDRLLALRRDVNFLLTSVARADGMTILQALSRMGRGVTAAEDALTAGALPPLGAVAMPAVGRWLTVAMYANADPKAIVSGLANSCVARYQQTRAQAQAQRGGGVAAAAGGELEWYLEALVLQMFARKFAARLPREVCGIMAAIGPEAVELMQSYGYPAA